MIYHLKLGVALTKNFVLEQLGQIKCLFLAHIIELCTQSAQNQIGGFTITNTRDQILLSCFPACSLYLLVQDCCSDSSLVVFITANMNKEGEKRICPLLLWAFIEIIHDTFSYRLLERTQSYGPMWLQEVQGEKMIIIGLKVQLKTWDFMTKDNGDNEQWRQLISSAQKQTELRYVLEVKLAGFDDYFNSGKVRKRERRKLSSTFLT